MIADKANTFEVDFHKFCPMCIHFDKKVSEQPCMDCLDIPMRYGTRKPTDYEEAPVKKKKS